MVRGFIWTRVYPIPSTRQPLYSMEREEVMNDTSSLQGVEDTLYIPLYARIYASKRFPDYFYDENLTIKEKLKKSVKKSMEQMELYLHLQLKKYLI